MAEWWELNKRQVAGLLGVSEPTVAKWVDEGMPCIERGGAGRAAKFDARAAVKWWRDAVVVTSLAKGDGKAASSSLASREAEVDIRLKELKFAKESDLLLPKADALVVVRHGFAQMNAALDAMPQREAHRLLTIGVKEMVDAVEVLKVIANQIRRDLRAPERWRPVVDETPS